MIVISFLKHVDQRHLGGLERHVAGPIYVYDLQAQYSHGTSQSADSSCRYCISGRERERRTKEILSTQERGVNVSDTWESHIISTGKKQSVKSVGPGRLFKFWI